MSQAVTLAPDAAAAPQPGENGSDTPAPLTWRVPFLAGFLPLTATFVNFLAYQGYPLLTLEVFALIGVLAAVSLAAAALYRRCGALVQRLLEGFLIAVLADFNFATGSVAIGIGIAVFVGLHWFRKSLVPFLPVFGGIILLVTLAGLGGGHDWITETGPAAPAAASARSDRPALVHLVLDEHIGIGGLPRTEAGQATARDLTDYYLAHGFAVRSHAYSEHMHTVNAIPDMLNFGTRLADSASRNGMVVGPTAYFDRLQELGYDLSIYQSQFGDFCSGVPAAPCVTYDSVALAPVLDYDLSRGERTVLLVSKFAKLSELLGPLEFGYSMAALTLREKSDVRLPLPPRFAHKSSTLAALNFFGRLERDFGELRPGQAVFAHLLFPHYPYAADERCAIKPQGDWRHRRDWSPKALREADYYAQLRCVTRLVDRTIAALDASPAAGNYILLIHGDHGSRLTSRDPVAGSENITDEDLIASFSTLYAVRYPRAAGERSRGSIDPRPAPVSKLLEANTLTGFKPNIATVSTDEPSVILDDKDWRPRERRALPSEWLRGSGGNDEFSGE